MKQSDIFTIIIIASIGMVGAFFASNAILGNPDELTMKHKNISPISTEVVEPDPETFNRDAINPTVEVYVGQCELVACGKARPEEAKEEQKTEDKQKKDEGQTGGQTNNNSNSTGGPATENQNSNTGNSNNASSSSSSQNRAGSTE